ncbi:hypothetical protein FJU08_18735 [Martelella alba]|uniref:Uncharacterized protein n=1 Tax=Martelella alba TaxID=2590451 RepID=A0A506U655_9HYPH|nr:hypothetical protein [Martelella alba]TPW28079.1 hypothetical protein FJU08_18735 [Martelella alba]
MKLQNLLSCFCRQQPSAREDVMPYDPERRPGKTCIKDNRDITPDDQRPSRAVCFDPELLIPAQPDYPAPGWFTEQDKRPGDTGQSRTASTTKASPSRLSRFKRTPLRLFSRSLQSQPSRKAGIPRTPPRPVPVEQVSADFSKPSQMGATMIHVIETATPVLHSAIKSPPISECPAPTLPSGTSTRPKATAKPMTDRRPTGPIFKREIATISYEPPEPAEPAPDYDPSTPHVTLWFPDRQKDNQKEFQEFGSEPVEQTSGVYHLPDQVKRHQADFEAMLRQRRRGVSGQANRHRLQTIPENEVAETLPRMKQHHFETLSQHHRSTKGKLALNKEAKKQTTGLPARAKRGLKQDEGTLNASSIMLTPTSSRASSRASLDNSDKASVSPAPSPDVKDRTSTSQDSWQQELELQRREHATAKSMLDENMSILAEMVAGHIRNFGENPLRQPHVKPGSPATPHPFAHRSARVTDVSEPEKPHIYTKNKKSKSEQPRPTTPYPASLPTSKTEEAKPHGQNRPDTPSQGREQVRTYWPPVYTEIFDV